MWWFRIFVVILAYGYSVDSEILSYCNTKVCTFSDEHTFCQFRMGPGTLCKGYMPVPLSREEQVGIVAKLNKRRSESANDEPQAANIMKMHWVKHLAAEAQLWADQCRPASIPEEHDVCRNLYSVSVGQCVGSVVGDAPGLRPGSFVDMWLLQSSRYKGNHTFGKPNRNCDDSIQMIAANSYMVGCGRSQFQSVRHGRLQTVQRLVCNFAPRGLHAAAAAAAKSLWSAGAPATDCPVGARPDDHYPNLCSFGQKSREIEEELFKREYYEWSAIINSKKVRRFLSDHVVEKASFSIYPTTFGINFTTHETPSAGPPINSSQTSLNNSNTRPAIEPTQIEVYTDNFKESFKTEDVYHTTDDFKIHTSRPESELKKQVVFANEMLETTNKPPAEAVNIQAESLLKETKETKEIKKIETEERSTSTHGALVVYNDTEIKLGKIEMILRYVTRNDGFQKFNKSTSFSIYVVLYLCCITLCCYFRQFYLFV